MRRARITYPGAFHHIMTRGYEGRAIFRGDKLKSQFLEFLADSSEKLRIKILAYCIMDNHYHMILQNSGGKMSEFLKRLNGTYGMYYRKVSGGKGYVFQSRFKSTLIEEDAYLVQSIVYLLRNPVRAGIVPHAMDYKWSSINSYFSVSGDKIVDSKWVNELFGEKESLLASIGESTDRELPLLITKYGEILGSEGFFQSAIKRWDRRKRPSNQSIGNQRIDDHYFDPAEKVIYEFECANGIKVDEIDTSFYKGKRLRARLLFLLKDRAGLTYKQISEYDIFGDLNFESLRSVYRNIKKKL